MDRLDLLVTEVAARPSEPLHGAPGALVFRSDVICPWSTVALIRLRRARVELGLDEFPVSTILALEAVQAARIQSEAAAEQLDLELRQAFFVRSRCITMLHEVLSAARSCDLDVSALQQTLEAGSARSTVLRQSREGSCSGVLVLPDGSEHCNPGVRTGWTGTKLPQVVPRVVSDDPGTVRDLVALAAGSLIEEDHHDHRD